VASTTALQPAKKVLIADGDDSTRQSLALFLREKGLEVFETRDGSRALAESLLRHPDVLLIDLDLPVLSAERLVQILRTNPNTKGTPNFFFSHSEKSVSGFRPGVDEFIRKPYHEDEVLLRIQRALYKDPLAESMAAESEISGSLSQIFLPDLYQMLAMNVKSGIIQVEGEAVTGSIYIENGDIVSATTQNITGEKALYRLVPLREGKFRFIPGKVGVRRTVNGPSQHLILEAMRHHDELKKMSRELPQPGDSVVLEKGAKEIPGGTVGALREVLLLAEFCTRVEDIVNNCSQPDLDVYEALISLRTRGALRIGSFETKPSKSEFLPAEDMARLRTKLEEKGSFTADTVGRIVLFLPDEQLLESVIMALGKFREFEVDPVFFSLRGKGGAACGLLGRIRIGEEGSLHLYTFPYVRSTSPLWYATAPAPIGVMAFFKDEVTNSLEGLLAVSDYTRGTRTGVVMAVMGKSFTNFGLGENTLRLFQNRVERMGCTLRVQQMDRLSPEEIREALSRLVQQYVGKEGAPA
jgi:CheY-like chemotaxis protein